jgi:5-methyltetrahydropteroyltriglutamate--homocysteine methyltransferase
MSAKTGELEAQEMLHQRIRESSRFVPLNRLALSPQCGFTSTHEGNRLSPEDQRRKLTLVADTARAVCSGVTPPA